MEKHQKQLLATSTVTRVPRSVASHFMCKYEHLGDVGLGVWHWGLILNEQIVGVVSYGTTCFSCKRGWLTEIATRAGCGIVQLCRGACASGAPNSAASRLICLANREMRRARGSLLVIAYADENYEEIGTIYQACNSVYTGLTNPKGQADYIIKGKKLSGWQVRKRYGTRARKNLQTVDAHYQVLELRPKHRYVMIAAPPRVSGRLRRMLEPYSRRYPKRRTPDPTADSKIYLPCSVSSDSPPSA